MWRALQRFKISFIAEKSDVVIFYRDLKQKFFMHEFNEPTTGCGQDLWPECARTVTNLIPQLQHCYT